MKLTEQNIQNALHDSYFSSASICMPNYTPLDWWECDFWHVTKAGYAVEHEIKLTRSDFLADAKKCKERWDKENGYCIAEFKHELLARRDSRCPKQFWFVVPKGMIKLDEIPEFAGLKEARVSRKRVYLSVVKSAPALNKIKVDPKLVEQVKWTFYYRYWNLRKKVI